MRKSVIQTPTNTTTMARMRRFGFMRWRMSCLAPQRKKTKQQIKHEPDVWIAADRWRKNGRFPAAGGSAPRRRPATAHVQPRVTQDKFLLHVQHEIGHGNSHDGLRSDECGRTAPCSTSARGQGDFSYPPCTR